MICATCEQDRPRHDFVVRRRRGSKRSVDRLVKWCASCRRAWAGAEPERPRAQGSSARALGSNPRALGTNPRAAGTNAVAGKNEQRGQWRAAWRRIDAMPPEDRHRALQRLSESADVLSPAVVAELRRRHPDRPT